MTRKITPRLLAEEELRLRRLEREQKTPIATIDTVAARTLDQAVGFYGIRAVLFELQLICSRRADISADNWNIILAKQWAAWCEHLERTRLDASTPDPGRE